MELAGYPVENQRIVIDENGILVWEYDIILPTDLSYIDASFNIEQSTPIILTDTFYDI